MISCVNVYTLYMVTLIVCGMPVLVEDAKIPIVVSSVFGALGILSCLTAICFIVLSKSYHLYVYRLTLYVALFNLAFAVVLELEVLPVDCHAKIVPGENCTGRYIFGYQICTAPVHFWSPKVYRPCQKCTAPVQFW